MDMHSPMRTWECTVGYRNVSDVQFSHCLWSMGNVVSRLAVPRTTEVSQGAAAEHYSIPSSSRCSNIHTISDTRHRVGLQNVCRAHWLLAV